MYYICFTCTRTCTVLVWRPEADSRELVLSSHLASSGYWTQTAHEAWPKEPLPTEPAQKAIFPHCIKYTLTWCIFSFLFVFGIISLNVKKKYLCMSYWLTKKALAAHLMLLVPLLLQRYSHLVCNFLLVFGATSNQFLFKVKMKLSLTLNTEWS